MRDLAWLLKDRVMPLCCTAWPLIVVNASCSMFGDEVAFDARVSAALFEATVTAAEVCRQDDTRPAEFDRLRVRGGDNEASGGSFVFSRGNRPAVSFDEISYTRPLPAAYSATSPAFLPRASPVPEPHAYLLMAVGLVGLCIYSRRRLYR